jgi:hypothetical protein
MKQLKNIFLVFLSILINIVLFSYSSAQDITAVKGAEVKNILDSQRYVFIAQTALPMGGRSRQLTPDYRMVISSDSVISDLPYYGRAYTAPMGSSEGGIKFTSTKFDYNIKETKKGKWDVIIKPKDATDVREVNLTIFDSGSASVQVTSNNRQPMSFNGYIARKGS